jgi:hypothetical protein
MYVVLFVCIVVVPAVVVAADVLAFYAGVNGLCVSPDYLQTIAHSRIKVIVSDGHLSLS